MEQEQKRERSILSSLKTLSDTATGEIMNKLNKLSGVTVEKVSKETAKDREAYTAKVGYSSKVLMAGLSATEVLEYLGKRKELKAKISALSSKSRLSPGRDPRPVPQVWRLSSADNYRFSFAEN